MSKRVEMGEVTCTNTTRTAGIDGITLSTWLATHNGEADGKIGVSWSAKGESNILEVVPGRRYRVILERVDNV